MADIEIHGTCDERYASTRNAFEKNLAEGLELGAAFALSVEGETVVDLWGGHADLARTRPWQKNTIVAVSSCMKPVTSLCGLIAIDQGLFELDTPIARYWPEFGVAGKAEIPVRWVFCHSTGVCGFDQPMSRAVLEDWDAAVTKLAAQAPWFEPGTQTGYHALTYPFLIGELIRRTCNLDLDGFLDQHIKQFVDIDFRFRLDESPPDLAEIEWGADREIDEDAFAYRVSGRAWFDFGHVRARPMNGPPNGFGNARSLMRCGAILANRGMLSGHRFLSEATARLPYQQQKYQHDLYFDMPVRYGVGFGMASKEMPLPFEHAFHWGGYGGSSLVVEPDARVSWSYTPSAFGSDIGLDRRGARLAKAAIVGTQSLRD